MWCKQERLVAHRCEVISELITVECEALKTGDYAGNAVIEPSQARMQKNLAQRPHSAPAAERSSKRERKVSSKLVGYSVD